MTQHPPPTASSSRSAAPRCSSRAAGRWTRCRRCCPVLETGPTTSRCSCSRAGPTSTPPSCARAEEAFIRVLELDPADHYARFALGKALQRQGRLAEAHAQLRWPRPWTRARSTRRRSARCGPGWRSTANRGDRSPFPRLNREGLACPANSKAGLTKDSRAGQLPDRLARGPRGLAGRQHPRGVPGAHRPAPGAAQGVARRRVAVAISVGVTAGARAHPAGAARSRRRRRSAAAVDHRCRLRHLDDLLDAADRAHHLGRSARQARRRDQDGLDRGRRAWPRWPSAARAWRPRCSSSPRPRRRADHRAAHRLPARHRRRDRAGLPLYRGAVRINLGRSS